MKLLILKCSARKREDSDGLSARERYNGPSWQVYRAFARQRSEKAADIDVYALSARFGLFHSQTLIPYYEERMTEERMRLLQSEIITTFVHLVSQGYSDICLGLSTPYLATLGNWQQYLPSSVVRHITVTNGTEGVKLRQLRHWLWEEGMQDVSPDKQALLPSGELRGVASIGGVTIQFEPQQVIDLARIYLKTVPEGAKMLRDWYITVDEQRISPKWLVSKLTGLPSSKFQASAARRVLLQLGIPIQYISKSEKVN